MPHGESFGRVAVLNAPIKRVQGIWVGLGRVFGGFVRCLGGL